MPIEPRSLQARFDRAITLMLADRLSRGEPLCGISRTTRIPKSRLAALARAARLHYRGQHPTPDQVKASIAAVERHGLSCLSAARKVGISKSAVHRYVQRKRNQLTNSVGGLVVTKAKVWRCPEHGLINVWPCVACAAKRSKEPVSRGT